MYNSKEFDVVLSTDFYSYLQQVFYELGGDKFVPNWHLEVLCYYLEQARKGVKKRLIINVPPRSLKSIVVNVAWSTWLLGHNPKERIVSASYSADLAEKFARDSKVVMESEWYKRIFPRTRISPSRTMASDFSTTAHGARYTTSVDGTTTGRGGNFIIIDDPIKPTEAASENALNKVNDWYRNTIASRLDDPANGVIVLIMQRVHENDLTGYLLENSNEWTHIKIPEVAITDETWEFDTITFRRAMGRPLNPKMMGVDKINALRNELGTYVWSSQYQQEPCPAEGGIIKEEWLHYYPARQFDINNVLQLFISWDTANKVGPNNAYSAVCVVLLARDSGKYKFFLMDVVRGKWEMPKLLEFAKDLYNGWRHADGKKIPVKLLIEDKASGTQLIQLLQTGRDSDGYPFDIEAIKPETDKTSRLMGVGAYIENGTLLFPQEQKTWWPEFKKELLGFPGTKYKDQVDALTQCINYAIQL